MLVSSFLDQYIQDFTFGIDRTSQINLLAIDFQKNFIQMPGHMWSGPTLAQIASNQRPKVVRSLPNRLIGNKNTTFGQQIFHIAEARGEPDIEPDGLMDDLTRKPIPAIADFLHENWLPERICGRKPASP